MREKGVEELEHADFEGGRVLAAQNRYVGGSLDDLPHRRDHEDDGQGSGLREEKKIELNAYTNRVGLFWQT